MLGGLCITRKACRPMDDESPDDASGIVSNCSIKDKVMRMRRAQWWRVASRLEGDRHAYILALPLCRHDTNLISTTLLLFQHYRTFHHTFTEIWLKDISFSPSRSRVHFLKIWAKVVPS